MYVAPYIKEHIEAHAAPDEPCGTTLLGFLPFDPNHLDWREWFVETWMEGTTNPGRIEKRTVGEEPVEKAHHQGPGPHFVDASWDTGISHIACDPIIQCLATVNQETSNVSSGRGMLIARSTSDQRRVRPVIQLVCDYLRNLWRRVILDQRVGELNTAAGLAEVERTTFSVFPFEGSGSTRDITLGWPSGNNPSSPSPQSNLPRMTGDYNSATDASSRWLRINQNLFVLSGGGASMGATARQADAIGLALRLLERSLPDFEAWQQYYIGASAPFGFTIGEFNLVQIVRETFEAGASKAIQYVPRAGSEPVLNQGRSYPFHGGVSINRTHATYATLFDALRELRLAALRHLRDPPLPSTGGSCPWDIVEMESRSPATLTQQVVFEFAHELAKIAGHLLHESTHVLGWTAARTGTGISGDWFDGPSTFPGLNAIQRYDFPDTVAGALVLPHIPAFAEGMQWPAQLAPVRHYAVTMFNTWWESLLGHNRGPMNTFENNACRCKANSPSNISHPRHWGWYPKDGIVPCWEGPFEEFDDDLTERDFNFSCRQIRV